MNQKINCYYGKEDDESLCALISRERLSKDLKHQYPQVTIRVFPGDHHFDGDYENVVKYILSDSSNK